MYWKLLTFKFRDRHARYRVQNEVEALDGRGDYRAYILRLDIIGAIFEGQTLRSLWFLWLFNRRAKVEPDVRVIAADDVYRLRTG